MIVALALLAAASQAFGHGLAPADVDEILAGARSCAAATAPAGVDTHSLEKDGWGKASISANGKAVPTSLAFYGKGNLLLVFDASQAKPMCIITSRISSVAEFPKVKAAFASSYGAPVKDDGKGEQIFIAPDHRIIDLASTGTSDRPAVRVAVGPVFQETK